MANELLLKQGVAVCWADTTDYSNAGSGIDRTHQLDLTGVATTEAREGAKADLTATRAARYAVMVGIEMAVAAVGKTIKFYWSSSYVTTAGTGNDGGAAGVDGDYKNGEELEWAKQLLLIGALTLTADGAGTVQRACVGTFCPPTRFGQVIVLNDATGQVMHTDAVEMYVALVPILDELQ